jgi:hypothetical protein
MNAIDTIKPSTPACPYCGTTHGLRISRRDPRLGYAPDFICRDCFTATDTGPSFDDLEPMVSKTDWQVWARDRMEYEDPFGYERGRRW